MGMGWLRGFPQIPIQLLLTLADRQIEGLISVQTAEQYAASMVEKYHVVAETGSAAHKAADEILPILQQWGKQYLSGLTVSGAYAKNTAVSLSSDIDLLISLKSVPNMEIKQVFWRLFEFITDQNLNAHTRNVAIQLEHHGLKIDLVPAYQDHNGLGNILFFKSTGQELHTNVVKHIHLVANSGRQQEICALKIWRERQSLDFPSFYLEMTVLQALEGERFGQLAENVITVLRYLANRFERTIVRDPANAQNIVSEELPESAKAKIARQAREALYDENWEEIIW